jgi:dTDP-4-amino-4,6-dideoxygalactose transaminase
MGKTRRQRSRDIRGTLREYIGVKHAIAVCNGTVSLRIALLAAGIEAGDEVIVPPYTFLATATAVIEANATPVFVDIDRESFNIDPAEIEKAITPRTRAIIPVHLGGMPCDMDAIMAIAKRNDLIVIEDAAHAHGSKYNGPSRWKHRPHRLVLVPIVQEPHQRRRRNHHDQRRHPRRAL